MEQSHFHESKWSMAGIQTCLQMDARHEAERISDHISSISGTQPGELPGGVAYAGSKAGVSAITKVMALELGVLNIRVNAINPGLFESEMTKDLMQKEWLDRVTKRTVPLQTLGTSDPALTSLIRYLIHDSSEYVSGNIFIVDAGVTLAGVPIFSSL